VTERERFVDAYMKHEDSVAGLSRRFGISRKTGYKWIGRYLAGMELTDRSRRPHHSPNAVVREVEDAIVAARKAHPTWGPQKLREGMLRVNPRVKLPSVGAFALIFARNGLVRPRKRRRLLRSSPSAQPFGHITGPNSLWCVDFKGDFSVGRARCYPLTIMDAYSRYLIRCTGLSSTRSTPVRKVFERVFTEFGLPEAIRSDNGTPFASNAPRGLSELSAWWSLLGIRHERIAPGKPQQNGRHERMHLTLKQETAMPPQRSMHAQQRAFDHFRKEYNVDRPHAALGQRVPADYYQPSARPVPDPIWGKDFAYDPELETARLDRRGRLRWATWSVVISEALAHRLIGLRWQPRGRWDVYFGKLLVGTIAAPRGTRRATFIPVSRKVERPPISSRLGPAGPLTKGAPGDRNQRHHGGSSALQRSTANSNRRT
jgi:transposase InsO family protein